MPRVGLSVVYILFMGCTLLSVWNLGCIFWPVPRVIHDLFLETMGIVTCGSELWPSGACQGVGMYIRNPLLRMLFRSTHNCTMKATHHENSRINRLSLILSTLKRKKSKVTSVQEEPDSGSTLITFNEMIDVPILYSSTNESHTPNSGFEGGPRTSATTGATGNPFTTPPRTPSSPGDSLHQRSLRIKKRAQRMGMNPFITPPGSPTESVRRLRKAQRMKSRSKSLQLLGIEARRAISEQFGYTSD